MKFTMNKILLTLLICAAPYMVIRVLYRVEGYPPEISMGSGKSETKTNQIHLARIIRYFASSTYDGWDHSGPLSISNHLTMDIYVVQNKTIFLKFFGRRRNS